MTRDYRFSCCAHCEDDQDTPFELSHDDGHDMPCEYGCNDGEGTA